MEDAVGVVRPAAYACAVGRRCKLVKVSSKEDGKEGWRTWLLLRWLVPEEL